MDLEARENRRERKRGMGWRRSRKRGSTTHQQPGPSVAPTLMVSPSISTAFSLKSTPMVASVLSGKLPPVKRKVRHVLPTLESPMTMILKIRVWMLSSREEVLRSTEDARLGAAAAVEEEAAALLPLLARLRPALWRSMDGVRMVTLSSARFLRATALPKSPPPLPLLPLPPPPLPPGARASSSGESLVMMPEEAMRKSVCRVARRGAARRGEERSGGEGRGAEWGEDGRMDGGKGGEEEREEEKPQHR